MVNEVQCESTVIWFFTGDLRFGRGTNSKVAGQSNVDEKCGPEYERTYP